MGSVLPLTPRRVRPIGAIGCVMASDAVAACDLPPFANSAMDGYAIRAVDTSEAPVTLSVLGTVLAGSDPGMVVGPGEAVRIMTGAPVPAGADAVCMVERTSVASGGSQVTIESPLSNGENVRCAGEDVTAGDTVVKAGAMVSPAVLAALIGAGVTEVAVHPRPTVGVLSTGDELVDAGSQLSGGQIYDSNRPMLCALVDEAGAASMDLGHAADDEAEIAGRIGAALGTLDALVLSGGVSVGDVDLVRVVLDKLGGGTARWMQIAIRPAKPFCFAVLGGKVPAFGLPGNPVSAAVSFELLVRPALLAMAGHARVDRPLVSAVAAEALPRRSDGKTQYVRVCLTRDIAGWVMAPCIGQGSHQIRSLALADGLAILPDGDGAAAGEAVPVMVTNPDVLCTDLATAIRRIAP